MVQETRKRAIIHSADLDFGSIAAGVDAEVAVTLPASADVVAGDVVVANCATLEAGLVVTAFVSDANEVTVRVGNITAAPVVPADGQTFNLVVFGG